MPERQHGKGAARSTLFLALLVTAAVVTAVRANFWKTDLRVASVEVRGNSIVPSAELLSLAHIAAGEKLFDVDLYAASKRLLENRFVRSASVNREVPDRITISVRERIPIGVVLAQKKLYLDAEGYVLPPAVSENIFDLPVLTGPFPSGDLVPGRRVSSPLMQEGLSVLTTARALGDDVYRQLSEVRVEEGKDILAYTAEGGIPVIIGHGDLGPKLVKFEGFWNDIILHHGVQDLQYIDLRFDDRVVVRWTHTPEDV